MNTSIRHIAPTAEFGINLLRNEVERKPDENVWLSPVNVSIAIGMTANGARAKTYDNMVKALCLKHHDVATNNAGYANLIAALTGDDLGVELAIANSLWGNEHYAFKPEFMETNRKLFGAAIENRDLTTQATLSEINRWIKESTRKIDKMLDEPLTVDDVLLLLSAFYMKARWKTEFPVARTREMEWRLPGGKSKAHPLMFLPSGFRQSAVDNARVAVLPFGKTEDRVNKVVMVPQYGKVIGDVLAKLTPSSLYESLRSAVPGSTDGLYFPRHTVAYESTLNETMKALGMEDAFDGRCNLKGIMVDETENPYIAEIKHKAMGQFDEKGAVVAAATSVRVALESCPQPFTVDQPFVSFIVDRDTGAMLAAGVINDPQRITEETDWSGTPDAAPASEVADEEGDI